MVNLKLKGALVAGCGSQAAAAQAFGCAAMTERRLSRLVHGYDLPRPEEARIIREKFGVELNSQPVEAR
jgi:hypothetical protein